MSVDQILQAIQDFRTQLGVWGISNQTLIAVAVLALALLFVSLREVAGWYFRISHVRSEVRQLQRHILELQRSLDEQKTLALDPESAESQPTGVAKAANSKFRLDH